MVKEFVSAGVAVNQPSNIGALPAAYAADCGQYDAALYLLDHGADPDQADRSGKTLRDVVAEKRKSAGAAVPEELKQLSERLGMH
jgi:ankyrin repeat protein